MKRYAGEFLILVSIGTTSYGAWLHAEPLGFVVGGLMTGGLGWLLLPLGIRGGK